jgi:hypothetical protein
VIINLAAVVSLLTFKASDIWLVIGGAAPGYLFYLLGLTRSQHELELADNERKSVAQTISLRIELTVQSTKEKGDRRRLAEALILVPVSCIGYLTWKTI